MFEFPWTKARKRREAAALEAARVEKLLREEKERRAAQVLADQIHRSQIAARHRMSTVPARPASVTPIKATGYGLTAQRAAEEDRKRRDYEDVQKRAQLRSDEEIAHFQAQALLTSLGSGQPQESAPVEKMEAGGGSFDGGGASGDWSSGSSSSDSGSSGGGDSGGGGGGGSD
jgi:uncharacterized membrane protein YgcG